MTPGTFRRAFHYPLAVGNKVYPQIKSISAYGSTQTNSGSVFVPPATESFTYDADGNLLTDGRWTYTWDAENRLIQMVRDTNTPSGAQQKLDFEYDYQGRRIHKKFSTYSSGWVAQTNNIYLYDGWNLTGELDVNNSNAKVRTYVWGTDLSGSLQGAGGVGGLLKVTDYTSGTTHHFAAYDGNGNLAALVDAGTAAVTARYEYGPFGESLRRTGTAMATNNPIRFSSKFTDNESGMSYYGYRFCNPAMGRWLSRDPIQERGGFNLYGFNRCDAVNKIDWLGLKPKLQCELNGTGALLSFTFDGVTFSGDDLSLPAASGVPIKIVKTRSWETVPPGGYSTWFYHSEEMTFDYSVARQRLRNAGPIPEGSYYIENCEERSFRKSPYSHGVKRSAWGDYSWSLHAEPETETYGRSGFFIHGGNRWGSAGCIDIRGGDAQLHNLMKKLGNCGCCFIPVAVKYAVGQVTQTDTVLDKIISGPVGW